MISGSRCLIQKKNFKKIILAKKRRHRNSVFVKLQEKRNDINQKEFWKIFRKISPKSKKGSVQPNLHEFRKYFEKLSHTDRTQDFPNKSDDIGPLDFVMTEKELKDAGGRLKLGKSVGIDNTSNEMIISLLNTCLLYTSPSPRDYAASRMPSSA